jgi:8-oxo-dGTP pyrophosphatase MutT (NUDIX family)
VAGSDVTGHVLRRSVARVVLLDRSGDVLLIEGRDPADAAKGSWWEIPGGGLDPGESTADAARRELFEETGIRDAEIGPCIWTQRARFTFGGWRFDQVEHVHVAWSERHDPASVRPGGLEALEALAFGERRWWAVQDLLACTDRVLPVRLREFLPDVSGGSLPATPIDITHDAPDDPPW